MSCLSLVGGGPQSQAIYFMSECDTSRTIRFVETAMSCLYVYVSAWFSLFLIVGALVVFVDGIGIRVFSLQLSASHSALHMEELRVSAVVTSTSVNSCRICGDRGLGEFGLCLQCSNDRAGWWSGYLPSGPLMAIGLGAIVVV